MKALINWKQKAGLMALGSVFTIIGMLLSPISAQKDNKFGDIECTSLKVTGDINCSGLFLTTDKSGVPTYTYIFPGSAVFSKRGAGRLYIDDILTDSLVLRMYDTEMNKLVSIGTDIHGGFVQTNGRSKGYAIMGINEKGNGAVSTYDKHGYRQ